MAYCEWEKWNGPQQSHYGVEERNHQRLHCTPKSMVLLICQESHTSTRRRKYRTSWHIYSAIQAIKEALGEWKGHAWPLICRGACHWNLCLKSMFMQLVLIMGSSFPRYSMKRIDFGDSQWWLWCRQGLSWIWVSEGLGEFCRMLAGRTLSQCGVRGKLESVAWQHPPQHPWKAAYIHDTGLFQRCSTQEKKESVNC